MVNLREEMKAKLRNLKTFQNIYKYKEEERRNV